MVSSLRGERLVIRATVLGRKCQSHQANVRFLRPEVARMRRRANRTLRTEIGSTMTSFPSALRSVFKSRGAPEVSRGQSLPNPWPLFKLVAPHRVEMPVEELTSMVESEIIPRLYQAHPPAAVTALELENPLASKSPRAFVRMVLSRSPDALTAVVETKRREGVDDDTIYAELLAPAARLMVDLWQDDEVSYTEVTIGLGRLQQLVRGLDAGTPYNGENDPSAPSALFAPCPGEQQTFGFFMIEELFRWSGWRTWIETTATKDDLVTNVRCRWFDTVCLSVSRSDNFEELSATIKSIRRSSRNRDIFILVNGRPFTECPESVAFIGADASASNGAEALHVADKALRSVAAE